ncbi:MAG: S1C family serine protease [Planctomycetota bacterium]
MACRKALAPLVCLAALACGPAIAADAGLKAAAKAVVDKSAATVVPVKIVTSVKVTYRGREMPSRESESEVLGTVLDETGLIVTSDTAADPSRVGGGRQPGVKIESELKAVKLIRKDGTEVTLKIVLRDKDLDLMFLRPEKKLALPQLGVKKKGPKLAIADHVITLSRLEAVGDRQPSVSIVRVRAVIDKPRRFYVTDFASSMRELGCPAFTAAGELIGIVTIRVNRGGRAGMLPVILPVEDVLEDMQQIEPPEGDEEDKAKEEPKEGKKAEKKE